MFVGIMHRPSFICSCQQSRLNCIPKCQIPSVQACKILHILSSTLAAQCTHQRCMRAKGFSAPKYEQDAKAAEEVHTANRKALQDAGFMPSLLALGLELRPHSFASPLPCTTTYVVVQAGLKGACHAVSGRGERLNVSTCVIGQVYVAALAGLRLHHILC